MRRRRDTHLVELPCQAFHAADTGAARGWWGGGRGLRARPRQYRSDLLPEPVAPAQRRRRGDRRNRSAEAGRGRPVTSVIREGFRYRSTPVVLCSVVLYM
jgi:hypothetical protein